MSDTTNNNMLGRLRKTNEEIEEIKNKIIDRATKDEIEYFEEIQKEITELINILPKEIYNFKKNDYIICHDRLASIISRIDNIEEIIKNARFGLDGIQITAGMAKVNNELEQCMRKSENKINNT